jgi:hypothetical protein
VLLILLFFTAEALSFVVFSPLGSFSFSLWRGGCCGGGGVGLALALWVVVVGVVVVVEG